MPATTVETETPPSLRLLQMLGGYQVSKALYVVAKLGVADLIAAGVDTSEELAARTGAVPQRLHRILRTLSGFGIVTGADEGRWSLTELGESLRTDVPGSVRQMAIMWNEEHYDAFGRLLEAVQEDRPGFELAFGTDFWTYLGGHPESAATFDAAMGDFVRQSHAAAASAYDFTAAQSLVDVGGGSGGLAMSILERHPHLEATVYDRPHVIERTRETLAASPIGARIGTAAGDFFDSVPAGADTYLLSFILHDWNDDEAAAILRNVRSAIADDGRLLLVEFVLPNGDEPHLGKLIDLTMLGMLTGRERTEREFERLLDASGFVLERVHETPAPVSVIEGRPA